jgi:Ni,Fe-hydrogenase III component G
LELQFTQDFHGNLFAWCQLPEPALLDATGKALAKAEARLCTITAFNKKKFDPESDVELVYSFDIDGTVLTLTLPLPATNRTVPSLMHTFFNADWNEREFAELFDIEITGRPKPERLFLDPSIDSGVFNRLVPLSSMMNGASTKQLWETIFAETTMPEWAKETQ